MAPPRAPLARSRDADTAVRAAGGVLWRERDGGVQVALVHRPRYNDWSLPKGKLDAGETELAAAVREVGEEAGARVAVSRRLTRVAYEVAGGSGNLDKTVAYWAMRDLGGRFRAGREVDALEWAPVDAARRALSYPADIEVLDDFARLPVPESVLVLVRHAKAGKRTQWKGDDNDRPLDATGRTQARRLVGFLSAFAPDRVVSAEPVRCVQTVQPLADSLGLTIAIEPALGDVSYERDPKAGEAAFFALARPRRVSLISSQGDTIPDLVARLVPGLRDTDTRKGGVWVLPVVDGQVLAADYYPDAAR